MLKSLYFSEVVGLDSLVSFVLRRIKTQSRSMPWGEMSSRENCSDTKGWFLSAKSHWWRSREQWSAETSQKLEWIRICGKCAFFSGYPEETWVVDSTSYGWWEYLGRVKESVSKKLKHLRSSRWSIFISFTCFSSPPTMKSSVVTNPTPVSLYRFYF